MPGATSMTFYVPQAWAGLTVSVGILGIYAGDYTVGTDGSVVVPYASDAAGTLTAAYLYTAYEAGVSQYGPLLAKFSVYHNGADTVVTLPVIIGRKYTSKGQLVPPDQEAQSRSPGGPGQAKTRRLHMVGARFANVVYGGVSLGTDFSHMHAVNPVNLANTPIALQTLWSGMYWDAIDDDVSLDGGQIAWQTNSPYPCTVVSLTGFFRIADR